MKTDGGIHSSGTSDPPKTSDEAKNETFFACASGFHEFRLFQTGAKTTTCE